jgi:hypothetical protein
LRRTIAIVVTVLALVAAVGVSTTSAGAKLIDHEAGHVDDTILDNHFCGIPVTTHVVGSSVFQVKVKGGAALVLSTGHLTFTHTTDDGRWVTFSFSGPEKDLSVTQLGGNIIVVRHILAGIGVSLRASNGDGIRTVGNTLIEATIDDGGTPLDLDDDVILDVQVVRMSGAKNVDVDICGFATEHLG